MGLFIYFGLFVCSFIFIKEIKELIIPVKMRTMDWISLVGGILLLIFITVVYGNNWEHYSIGILACITLILSLAKRGVSHRGFNAMRGFNRYKWDRLKGVEIIVGEEHLRVEFNVGYSFDVQFYKKEDYDRIMEVLGGNLSQELVAVRNH